MVYLCKMKDLIFKFLDKKYPDATVRETIFNGLCVFTDKGVFQAMDLRNDIQKYFSVDVVDAYESCWDWMKTKPGGNAVN